MKAISRKALAWRNKLPDNFRPAITAVLHGGIQIQVQSLSQVSFDGIRIKGTMQGTPCPLLAHQSTVQILCYAEEVVKKENARQKKDCFYLVRQ